MEIAPDVISVSWWDGALASLFRLRRLKHVLNLSDPSYIRVFVEKLLRWAFLWSVSYVKLRPTNVSDVSRSLQS